jgi:hypothetical protein
MNEVAGVEGLGSRESKIYIYIYRRETEEVEEVGCGLEGVAVSSLSQQNCEKSDSCVS